MEKGNGKSKMVNSKWKMEMNYENNVEINYKND
jgi:hypothetical protein